MKSALGLFLAWLSLFGSFSFGQEKSAPTLVSIVELLVAAEKFDGQRIEVIGYLEIIQEPRHPVRSFLYLHEEDAEHWLPQSIPVFPSDKMIEDIEQLNREYVSIIGTVTTIPRDGTGFLAQIGNVEECYVWSRPSRPRTDDSRVPE